MPKNQPKKIVTIGGGKGQATILKGLKEYNGQLKISAIVSMSDDGGSTGRISKELRKPPFGGDFRDVLTALSNNQLLVDLFHHRYEQGSEIKGHSVGNLILHGLFEKAQWDIPESIEMAKKLLMIDADVLPSTLDRVQLVAEYEDGSIITGQNQIDDNLEKKFQTINKIYTKPKGRAYKGAKDAIKEADLIVLCPGDLYGSLLCNLVIPGMDEAIKASKAKIIYITNLMTKVNQTHKWKTSNFIDEVQRYLPRKLTYAILNTGNLDAELKGQKQYSSESWETVKNDLKEETYKRTKLIKDKIWLEGVEFKRVSSDVIPRSFVRHDPHKLARIIMSLT